VCIQVLVENLDESSESLHIVAKKREINRWAIKRMKQNDKRFTLKAIFSILV
jgi:hypothetical protein